MPHSPAKFHIEELSLFWSDLKISMLLLGISEAVYNIHVSIFIFKEPSLDSLDKVPPQPVRHPPSGAYR